MRVTNRHLNEYISMDFEMGFIKDEEDIMEMEERLLKFILNKLEEEGKIYLETLNVDMPKIENKIPKIKFSEALEILEKEYNKTYLDGDLDPEGEQLFHLFRHHYYDYDDR